MPDLSKHGLPANAVKGVGEVRKRHQHWSGSSEEESRCKVVWMMASQPPFIPTPSWRGVSEEIAKRQEVEARHLEVSRCRTSPTVMGWWLPLFLGETRRMAPQRWGRTEEGALPAANRLTRLVRVVRAWAAQSGEGHRIASWRWLGRRPEGPGAEALGNDRTPLRTAGSERMAGDGTGSRGTEGGGASLEGFP